MIKFFRKIRYNLMNENKTGKYLKYAFGEIILVVIGILIALQLNSLNQKRENKLQEKKYLIALISDLDADIEDYKRVVKRDSTTMEAIIFTLNKFKNNELFTLSDKEELGSKNFYIADFRKQDVTFKDMQSSGKLNLIQMDSLRQQIIEYYNTVDAIESVQETNNAFIVDLGSRFLGDLDFNSIVHSMINVVPEVDEFDLSLYNNRNSKEVFSYQNFQSLKYILVIANDNRFKSGLIEARKVKATVENYLEDF